MLVQVFLLSELFVFGALPGANATPNGHDLKKRGSQVIVVASRDVNNATEGFQVDKLLERTLTWPTVDPDEAILAFYNSSHRLQKTYRAGATKIRRGQGALTEIEIRQVGQLRQEYVKHVMLATQALATGVVIWVVDKKFYPDMSRALEDIRDFGDDFSDSVFQVAPESLRNLLRKYHPEAREYFERARNVLLELSGQIDSKSNATGPKRCREITLTRYNITYYVNCGFKEPKQL
jgi:hypothetical protein